MLRVALQEYQSRIEGLIEENRLPEAAAHCHFLLQQYPRHIGTYRLFGRALLEQQLYNDTLDIFSRVISADPEDLLAHAGLALAYREKKDLNSALWHMKRAFEMEPYNRAIQNELRDLYERLDIEPVREFGLNKAALARIYFKGGLYGKAAIETKALLKVNSGRSDLQVLLADIYYWADRPQDADQQCQMILNQLPYCVKANAILADLRLKKGHFQEAKKYLSTLQSVTLMTANDVDPESTVGSVLSGHADITLPGQISVDALGEIGPASAQLSYDSEWLHEIGVEQELETTTAAPVEDYDVVINTSVPEEPLANLVDEESDWMEDISIGDIIDASPQIDEITDRPLEITEPEDAWEASQLLNDQVEHFDGTVDSIIHQESPEKIDNEEFDWLEDVSISDIVDAPSHIDEIEDLPLEIAELGDGEESFQSLTDAVEDIGGIVDTSIHQEPPEILENEEFDWLEDVSIGDLADASPQVDEFADKLKETTEPDNQEEEALTPIEETVESAESQLASTTKGEEFAEDVLSLGEFGDELPSWTELNEEVDLMGSNASDQPVDEGWLAQIAPSQSTENGLPKWIYESMGFSDEMEDSPDFELPEWLQDSLTEEETTDEEPALSDQLVETDLTANHARSEDPGSAFSPEEIDYIDKGVATESLEETITPEPTIEELLTGTDELIDRTTKPPPDQPIDAAFDALPWLDDMLTADEKDQEEDTQPAEISADENGESLKSPPDANE